MVIYIHTAVPLLLLPVFCEKTEGILENLIGFAQFGIFSHQLAFILVQWRIAADSAADKSMLAISLALLTPLRQLVVGHTKLCGCLLDSNLI